jgi:ParB family chromosome partitioning protein
MSKAQPAPAKGADIFHPGLPIDVIDPSPTNPRKHINGDELAELAESIQAHGVVSPIVVRRREAGRYEIVFGERRYRAARTAGLAEIPAIEREYDDKAVVEVQIIENVQREDVHELDEANGYRELIDHHGYTAKSIGERIGKSQEYVYGRLKLAGLIPKLQKLFYSRELTAGHAILIARLPHVSQESVLEKGLFETVREGKESQDVLVSVRDLGGFIKQEIQRDLDQALFDRNDATVLPAAGACVACVKRSGSTCLDPICFNQKSNAFINKKVKAGEMVAATTDWTKREKMPMFWNLNDAKAGSCPHVKTAVCIDGHQRGETKRVCLEKTCKVHYGSFGAYPKRTRTPEEQLKNAQQSIETLAENKLRKNVYAEVAAKVETAPTMEKAFSKEAMILVAQLVYERLDHSLRAQVTEELKLKKGQYSKRAGDSELARYAAQLDQVQLAGFIVRLALRATLEGYSGVFNAREPKARAQLLAIAKQYGVKVERIQEEAEQLRKERLKKARARIQSGKLQTSAKRKKK